MSPLLVNAFRETRLGGRLEAPARRVVQRRRMMKEDGARHLINYRSATFLAGHANKIEAKLLSGDYDRNNLDFCLSVLKPGDHCLDIGANIGVYSVLFGRAVEATGSVHSFEPVSHLRDRLKANVLLNSLDNVEVYSFCLGREQGQLPMRQIKVGSFRAGVSTLVANENVAELGQEAFDTVQVAVRPLDQVIEEAGITRLQLIKMDVEGFESQVLQGARKTFRELRPLLLMEHNQRRLRHLGVDEQIFSRFAHEAGYSFHELRDGGGRPSLVPFAFDRELRTQNIVGLPSEIASGTE